MADDDVSALFNHLDDDNDEFPASASFGLRLRSSWAGKGQAARDAVEPDARAYAGRGYWPQADGHVGSATDDAAVSPEVQTALDELDATQRELNAAPARSALGAAERPGLIGLVAAPAGLAVLLLFSYAHAAQRPSIVDRCLLVLLGVWAVGCVAPLLVCCAARRPGPSPLLAIVSELFATSVFVAWLLVLAVWWLVDAVGFQMPD